MTNSRFTPTCVGKLNLAAISAGDLIGSPPRVWGNCAALFLLGPSLSVHPHVCGETDVSHRMAMDGRRFTPTCVGKLPCVMSSSAPMTVHPHVCGETGKVDNFFHATERFTPTCVGKLTYSIL